MCIVLVCFEILKLALKEMYGRCLGEFRFCMEGAFLNASVRVCTCDYLKGTPRLICQTRIFLMLLVVLEV